MTKKDIAEYEKLIEKLEESNKVKKEPEQLDEDSEEYFNSLKDKL